MSTHHHPADIHPSQQPAAPHGCHAQDVIASTSVYAAVEQLVHTNSQTALEVARAAGHTETLTTSQAHLFAGIALFSGFPIYSAAHQDALEPEGEDHQGQPRADQPQPDQRIVIVGPDHTVLGTTTQVPNGGGRSLLL